MKRIAMALILAACMSVPAFAQDDRGILVRRSRGHSTAFRTPVRLGRNGVEELRLFGLHLAGDVRERDSD